MSQKRSRHGRERPSSTQPNEGDTVINTAMGPMKASAILVAVKGIDGRDYNQSTLTGMLRGLRREAPQLALEAAAHIRNHTSLYPDRIRDIANDIIVQITTEAEVQAQRVERRKAA
jgi:hypothetical protein